MRELLSKRLWIGNAFDIRGEHAELFALGIQAIVDIAAEEHAASVPRGLIYCRVPLQDDDANRAESIRLAVETTASLMRKSTPTLVCCSAGMSRSPTIASLAMSIVERHPAERMLTKLLAGQPHDISPGLWAKAIEACKDELTAD